MTARSRRGFFASLAGLGGGAAVLGFGLGEATRSLATPAAPARLDLEAGVALEGEATPLEDLMVEHAVLERVLLIYEEAIRRLTAGRAVDPAVDPAIDPAIIARAGGIVRRYIEDHHERDEERHVFPRLEQIGALPALIQTLRIQHVAGRRLTSEVIGRASRAGLRDASERAGLITAMQQFLRMYRPHAARENTVLFPALRKAVPQPEYEQLRATLERDERATLGPDVLETTMTEVRELERALGIDDLAAFTPEAL